MHMSVNKVVALGCAVMTALGSVLMAAESSDRWLTALKQMDVQTKKDGICGAFLFSGKQAVPALQQMLNDSPDVAWAAAAALARLGDRSGFPVLVRELAGATGERAAVAASILSQFPGVETAAALQKAASGIDENVRWNAIRALGESGDRSAIPVLEKAVRSDEWFIREGAASALYHAGEKDLVRRLMKDPDKTVRWAAVAAMNEVRDASMFEALKAAAGDRDYDVRAAAISVMGTWKDARALPILVGCINDPDKAIRWNAILSLGLLGDPRAAAPLQKLLGDRHADIRAAALKSLGDLRGVDMVPVFIRSLGDRDASVRGIAVSLLGRLRDRRAVPHLKNVFAREPEQRAAVLCALADIGDPSAASLAEEALAGDKSAPVVKAGLYALTRTGAASRLTAWLDKTSFDQKKYGLELVRGFGCPPGMETWLAAASGNIDRAIRIAAIRAMGRSTASPCTAALAQALSDQDPVVRRWAALMLGMSGAPGDGSRLVPALAREADTAAAFAGFAALRLLETGGSRPRYVTVVKAVPLIRWNNFKEETVRMLKPGDVLPACGIAGKWYVSEEGWVDRDCAEMRKPAAGKSQRSGDRI